MGKGYPRKLFNLEHFLIYGISVCEDYCVNLTEVLRIKKGIQIWGPQRLNRINLYIIPVEKL